MQEGYHELRVTITCKACNQDLYSVSYGRYQSKFGRWESGIQIEEDSIPAHDCPMRANKPQ